MGNELHPSSTSRQGNISTNAVTKGLHRDIGPFSAATEVWCQQCGFRCNTQRDSKDIDEFAGETITSGNELSNGSFEDWTAGSPDDWTISGTIAQEQTAGFYDWRDAGSSSVKIVRAGTDISLSQVAGTPSDFNDNFVIFRARVKSTTNGVIRLRIDVNGESFSSSYNVAGQRFQELAVQVQCPKTVTSLTVYILADSQDGTAYVDSSILARNGNLTTAAVEAGCPHCGSFNYNNPPQPFKDNEFRS